MKDGLFINGRFAWPPVITIVFLAFALIAADAVWRTVSLSFEALMIWTTLFTAVGLVFIFVFARLGKPRSQ